MSHKNPFMYIWLRTICLSVTLMVLCSTQPSSGAAVKPAPLYLTPQPVEITRQMGEFTLTQHTVIAAEGKGAWETAEHLATQLRNATGYPLQVVSTIRQKRDRNVILLNSTYSNPSLGREGYTLSITPGMVTISASARAGLFYGTDTLRQLLPPEINSPTYQGRARWSMPCVQIRDWPRFPVRGFMLDSSRHFQSVGFIERTISRMAFFKLNTFHWHLSDSQGWRLQIKAYPRLTSVGAWRTDNGTRYGGYYTQKQIREVVAYARARCVTIIPELDMPAHCVAALAAYPELACTSGPFHVLSMDAGDWSQDVMDPAKPVVYKFIDTVLTEVMRLFPSKVIHLGGDECPTQEWTSSADCVALMKAEHMTNPAELQNYFERKVDSFLSAHGHRLQGWDEILNGGSMPKSVIVQQWNYPSAASNAIKAGHDVVASMDGYLYLDSSNSATPLSRVYSYNPMPPGLTEQEQKRLIGVEACLWTESKPTNRIDDHYIWPRLIAVGELGWTQPNQLNWRRFMESMLHSQYQRLALMGISPPDGRESLIARSGFQPWSMAGDWKPDEMSEKWVSLKWDITSQIHHAGTYFIRFMYTAGADGIAINSCGVSVNGDMIDTDTHSGWAGGVAHDNTYKLDIKTFTPGTHYMLNVTLRSDGGTDSSGEVEILPESAKIS